MTMPAETELLTVPDMAADIKSSEKHVRRLIERGEVPVYRFGRLIRVSRADWEAYKARCRG